MCASIQTKVNLMGDQANPTKTTENKHRYHMSFRSWISRASVIFVADMVIVVFSYLMALLFRFDFKFETIPDNFIYMYSWLMPLWCLFTFVVFYAFRLYHSIWTYVSLDEAITVIKAYAVLSLLYVASSFILNMKMPRSFYFFGTLTALVGHICVRFAYRILRRIAHMPESRNRRAEDKKSHNVMIIGAGSTGSILIKELQNSPVSNQTPVCIIDDNVNKHGRALFGVPIVGGRDDIIEKAAEYNVETIIFAIPSASGTGRRQTDPVSISLQTVKSAYPRSRKLSLSTFSEEIPSKSITKKSST